MRRLFFLVATATVLTTGCNSNKKPGDVTITDKNGKEKMTINVNEMQKGAQEWQQKKEELEKLTPRTTEEMKALVPENLAGTPRSSYEVNSAMGFNVVNARYKINDTSSIRVTINDCAGPGGAGFYALRFAGMYNVESDNDREYTKTVEFNGAKAFERCRKDRNDCSFTYFAGDRYMVVLDGDDVGMDGLKSAAKELNIK